MPETPASQAVASVDPLDLADDALIESAVVLVKVSNPDGSSSLYSACTPSLSHWESVGMLVAAADHARGLVDWDDD